MDGVVKKFGEEQVLATEIVRLLKEKGVTYDDAITALKDAQAYLIGASLKNKL